MNFENLWKLMLRIFWDFRRTLKNVNVRSFFLLVIDKFAVKRRDPDYKFVGNLWKLSNRKTISASRFVTPRNQFIIKRGQILSKMHFKPKKIFSWRVAKVKTSGFACWENTICVCVFYLRFKPWWQIIRGKVGSFGSTPCILYIFFILSQKNCLISKITCTVRSPRSPAFWIWI